MKTNTRIMTAKQNVNVTKGCILGGKVTEHGKVI